MRPNRVAGTARLSSRLHRMKLLGTLAAYLAVTAALFGGLVGGVLWLVQPDVKIAREQTAAPIPPRIAESIARKSAPPQVAAKPAPEMAPQPVMLKEPEPVKPIMHEANVALTPAPHRVQVRELTAKSSAKPKPRPQQPSIAARQTPPASAPQETSSVSAQAVSTARTDSPY
jgi:hypothetical protein